MLEMLTGAAAKRKRFNKVFYAIFGLLQNLRREFRLEDEIDGIIAERNKRDVVKMTPEKPAESLGYSEDPAMVAALKSVFPGALYSETKLGLQGDLAWPPDPFADANLSAEACDPGPATIEHYKVRAGGTRKLVKTVKKD
jgi:hypothetical protein